MIVRSLLGALLGGVALTPVVLGARALRRRLVPDLSGPTAIVATAIIGIAIVVGLSEALGTFGGFRFWPLTVGFAAAGLVAYRFGGARVDASEIDETEAPAPASCPHSAVAIIAVAILSAEWITRVVDAAQRGITTPDSVWYHLPIAARFAQDGWTSRLHFVDASSLIVFFPSTSELLHAVGMVFLGNDFVSLFVNLGWLALALLSAWCIGARFGVAPVSLVGVAVVLATPELVLDSAGTGLNDMVGFALFLAALAFVVNATRPGVTRHSQQAEMLCGALAAGLAIGTKYTMVVPVAALTLGALAMIPAGRRIRVAARWSALVLIGGGYWYIRNLVRVGSPVPSVRVGIGAVHLPTVPYPGTSSVAHVLFRDGVWSTYLFPGLRDAFGPLWWAVAAVVGAGLVVGFVRPDRATRMLAFVGLACLAAFVVTPQILGSPDPIFFAVNARYVAPALLTGAVLLPIVLRPVSPRLVDALLAAYAVILVGTQFAPSLWRNEANIIAPRTVGSAPYLLGIAFGIVVTLIGMTWRPTQPLRAYVAARPTFVAASIGVALVVVATGAATAEQYYLRNRYENAPPFAAVDHWARDIHHARIAIVDVVQQYPFYGEDLTNHVQYLAARSHRGVSTRIDTCAAWRTAVNAGRYNYVIAATPGFPFSSTKPALEAEWTRSDPAAHLVVDNDYLGAHAWVYEIRGTLDPAACG